MDERLPIERKPSVWGTGFKFVLSTRKYNKRQCMLCHGKEFNSGNRVRLWKAMKDMPSMREQIFFLNSNWIKQWIFR